MLIICETKKNDTTNRAIPEIKNETAILNEMLFVLFGITCMLFLRRLNLYQLC
jgi:hypothetical protein